MYKQGIYDVSPDVFERYKEAYKKILSARYFEILTMRAGKKMTFRAIANHYGLTLERIRQICGSAKNKIEKAKYPTT